jgi:hypothetical protein
VATTTILRMLAHERSLTDNCGTQCVAVTLLSRMVGGGTMCARAASQA